MKGLSPHPGDKAAIGFIDSISYNTHPLSGMQAKRNGLLRLSLGHRLSVPLGALWEAVRWNGMPFVQLIQAYRLASS